MAWGCVDHPFPRRALTGEVSRSRPVRHAGWSDEKEPVGAQPGVPRRRRRARFVEVPRAPFTLAWWRSPPGISIRPASATPPRPPRARAGRRNQGDGARSHIVVGRVEFTIAVPGPDGTVLIGTGPPHRHIQVGHSLKVFIGLGAIVVARTRGGRCSRSG